MEGTLKSRKNVKKFYIVMLAALLAAAMTGCSLMADSNSSPLSGGEISANSTEDGTVESEDEDSRIIVSAESTISADSQSTAESSSFAANDITSQTVIDAYGDFAAFEDYWYKGGNADAMTQELIKHEGMDYCRYESGDIKSFADFESKALSLMTRPLFEKLQDSILYTDKDGALYGPVNYGKSSGTSFAGNQCEAVKLSEKEYELKVGHYYLASAFLEDAPEGETVLKGETTCKYILTESGWRFSEVEHKYLSGFAG